MITQNITTNNLVLVFVLLNAKITIIASSIHQIKLPIKGTEKSLDDVASLIITELVSQAKLSAMLINGIADFLSFDLNAEIIARIYVRDQNNICNESQDLIILKGSSYLQSIKLLALTISLVLHKLIAH